MYDHSEDQFILPDDFFLPFGGKLSANNRWVRLAALIPWNKVEQMYKEQLGDVHQGARAYPVRMALGALIIKERLGTSDQETVDQVAENPYLQYFLGLKEFQERCPFDSSSLTYFRKRISPEMIAQVNEWVIEEATRNEDQDDEPPSGDGGKRDAKSQDAERHPNHPSDQITMHQGKLLIDATCAPSDIAFPTDLTLLNRSREKLEAMIDTMHEERLKPAIKPRTYRKKARKQYLSVSKQKRPGKKKVRRAIKQQLNHVKRDLNHIAKLAEEVGLSVLSRQEYRDLLVIQELYRQQLAMYQSKQNRIDNRIVSIEQPHVRPIVRGKAHTSVEFGAKISVVMKDGWTFLDRLEWDSYHEGNDLQRAVMTYRDRYGYFPEAVLADRIYATRENRRFCKENGIRLSGPRLGRPPKHESVEDKQVAYQDACERNAIEAKFGEGKRSYGLGLIRARLKETSETVIALQILNLNLSKVLRDLPSFLIFILVAKIRDYFTDLQSTNNDEWVIQ